MIAFIADVHLGNHRGFGGRMDGGVNDRAKLTAEALAMASRTVYRYRAPLVVLGDLYDVANPTPQLITLAQGALLDESPVVPGPVLLLGNHDQVSTAMGDHALGPHADRCCVVENPCVIPTDLVELGLVPFRPGPAEDWLRSAVDGLPWPKHRRSARVLGLHLGIRDDDTPAYLATAHDSVPISLLDQIAHEHKIDAIVAGNWHRRKTWKRRFNGWDCTVMQVGALVPTGFDNPGTEGYGTLALYDGNARALTFTEIPGPRFEKLRGLSDIRMFDAERRLKLRSDGEKMFVRAHVLPADEEAARFQLSIALGDGIIHGYEVETDTTEATIEARAAAAVARSSATLAEALAGYVAEMPLDSGVDRAAVLARAQKYLGAS